MRTGEVTTAALTPAWRHLLSSIAGCTLGLMVKRFSATLLSKSTCMIQMGDETQCHQKTGDLSDLQLRINAGISQLGWWGKRCAGGHLRSRRWYHERAEWTEAGVARCLWYTLHCKLSVTNAHKRNISQSLYAVCLMDKSCVVKLWLQPCKGSASWSLWCETETSCAEESSIHAHKGRLSAALRWWALEGHVVTEFVIGQSCYRYVTDVA